MTAKRTDMHQIQELIRLHRLGTRVRAMSRSLSMGRETIRTYFATLRDAGLLDGPVDALPEMDALRAALAKAAPPTIPPQQTSSVAAFEPRILELRALGAGPQAIFDRIRLDTPEFGGSLSAIKRVCVRWNKKEGPRAQDVAIRVETLPGEIAQVDFGYVGELFDPEQRVMRRAWVFVMVLGYSRHQFAEIVFDQKSETWIDLHIRAFEFFGGVPAVIVPDYVPRHIIHVMWPPALCGREMSVPRRGRAAPISAALASRGPAHNDQSEASQVRSAASSRQTGFCGCSSEESEDGSHARSAAAFIGVLISA